MKTLKRCGILTAIMAVALLIPAGAAEARHRRGGVNVWVGPGGFGYSRGYYGGYSSPYYQPYYYYSYPSPNYYYSYPSYGSYYYPSPYYGGYYYGNPGFQFYIR